MSRIVLKLSGEAIAGPKGTGFDLDTCKMVAGQVRELVEKGTITALEARNHPRKNVLTRAVGVEAYVKVDTGVFSVERGDKVLLCTDGLTNMVSDEEIRDVLQADVENPATFLIGKALAAGGNDNITAIVAVYDE